MNSASAAWKYFERKTKDSAQCKLCFKTLKSSGNTSNMMKHLRSCHQNVCLNLKDDSGASSRKRQKSFIEEVPSSSTTLPVPDDTESHASPSTSGIISSHKQSKLMFAKDKEKVVPSFARDEKKKYAKRSWTKFCNGLRK
ncbi:hypothetical protein evm_013828 [Chilo suppressalis]|nr:hypothetical protein evm_013828 [Chilo suppressalis]